jgi:TolA-binding protein
MAERQPRDLLTRLADAGEEAIHRLSEAPGAERLVGAMSSMRDRVDEMQRRLLGLEAIERRVAELERRLAELEGGAKPAAHRASAATKRPSTRAKKTTSTATSPDAQSGTAPKRITTSRRTSSSG